MIIQVNNLSKQYLEGDVILKNINLGIEKGEVVSIIGPSGGGKSTLLRCLIGLEEIDSGDVKVPDKKKMGMVFQSFNLFPHKTAIQNIMESLIVVDKMDKSEAKKIAYDLLEKVGLKDRADFYPKALSGGQKQRVSIGRALANNPDILLSDEATSALDPKTTNSILELIKNIQQKFGLTVVMITHQMEVIRDICNRVAVMSDGEIVETGGVHHIFSNPKAEITKELISYLPSTEERGVEIMKTKGKYIVKLKFLGTIAEEPIISQALRKFDIDFSIIGGSIDHLSTMKVGHLFIELSGEIKQQQEAIEWFNESGVMVEVIYNGI